jgi:plasmid stabilization system protein ParE
LKVTYAEEAVADIVQAISYLNERNPSAAAKLDADIARCIEHLADREFEGPVSRLRCCRAELGRSAVPDLLPASC